MDLFDDILIQRKIWEDHLAHLDQALQLLQEHQLYVNKSKCFFGLHEIGYLGHVIFEDGVKVDPHKIAYMHDWPIPKSLKGMREFLGLKDYYQKFVKNYGKITAPLTSLLKKICLKLVTSY